MTFRWLRRIFIKIPKKYLIVQMNNANFSFSKQFTTNNECNFTNNITNPYKLI